ncbi:MAG: TetR/AcrR family transcriptional regulator [Pseudomonadota bacterium]
MKSVNTREKIKDAALALFSEKGFAKTSIAAIESAAGLAPRAGAFYRHFESKAALFEELARERLTETPDEFDFEGLQSFGDTRAELISLARQFEVAAKRQKPYTRLIEEVRLIDSGKAFEIEANDAMLKALMRWVATKPAGVTLEQQNLAALTMSIFGGWLFYLTKQQQGVELDTVTRDVMLKDWAALWAGILGDN